MTQVLVMVLKSFLMENLKNKNFKKSTLNKNLRNFIKNLKNGAFKKVPYQKNTLSRS